MSKRLDKKNIELAVKQINKKKYTNKTFLRMKGIRDMKYRWKTQL